MSAVEDAGLPRWQIEEVVARALDEDLGAGGDVTTAATVPANLIGSADLVPRVAGVVAGLPIAAAVFGVVSGGRVRIEFGTADGAAVAPGEVLATARGPIRDLLTAERTSLNLFASIHRVTHERF